jgi:hypothetical protein
MEWTGVIDLARRRPTPRGMSTVIDFKNEMTQELPSDLA